MESKIGARLHPSTTAAHSPSSSQEPMRDVRETAVTHLLLRRQWVHLTGMCGTDPFRSFLRVHTLEQVPPSLRTVWQAGS